MRFLHLSDTHLGYHQYGLSERAQDFFDVFNEAVDFAIDRKVDFVLHSGDFFHSSRPSNSVMLQGIDLLKRLKDAKIPVFVIPGNHDRGNQVKDVSPLHILEPLGIKIIDKGVVEHEGVFIGGLKYISKSGLKDDMLRQLLEKYLEIMGNGFKILLLHQEFQPFFPDSNLNLHRDLPEGFDYVGIGHYHIAQAPFEVSGAKVVYPGSTEFTAYNENEDKKGKGFYYVSVEGKEIKAEFVKLKNGRPFLFCTFEEEDIQKIISDINDRLNSINSAKKPVIVLRGDIKQITFSDIDSLLTAEGIKERALHIQMNLVRYTEADEGDFKVVSLSDDFIKNEIRSLIDDDEISDFVIEIIQHLKTFDSIDEVKKVLKEKSEILDF